MLELDPGYTAALLLVASLAMAAAMLGSASRQTGRAALGQGIWAHALILAPLGWLLLEAAALPGAAALAVAGKTLLMGAFVEHYRALRAFNGHRMPELWRFAPLIVVALLSTAWLLVLPGTPMRTGLLSLLCALVAAAAAREALSAAGPRGHGGIVALAFGVSAAVLAVRGLGLFSPEASTLRALAESAPGRTLLLGGALMAPAVASLGFALMGSDRLLERLQRIAHTDSLTGLATRLALLERLREAVAGARRDARPLALLIADVDHFKRINDLHGHYFGDVALRQIAEALQDAVPRGAVVGRFGGEEFAIVLPGHGLREAERVGAQLAAAIADIDFRPVNRRVPLGLSVGAGQLGGGDDSIEALLHRADQAMYAAKRTARGEKQPAGAVGDVVG